METSQRIEKLLEYSGLNVNQFAIKIGAKTPQGVRDILSGRTNGISSSMKRKILSCFPEVNPVWLLTGEGEMMNEASPDPDRAKEIVPNMGSVTIAPAASHVPYDLFKEMMEDRKRQDETIKELIRQNGMLLDLLYGKRRGQDGSDGNKP